MQLCAHGNIAITCPQCRGRALSSAPSPAQGFHPQPVHGVQHGHDDEAKTIDLNLVVDRTVDRITRTSDNQARQVKAFWSQINSPTTVEAHHADHS